MTDPGGWLASEGHRGWLFAEANRLIDFYASSSLDPAGGFFELGRDGSPTANEERHIVVTTRMVHCFSLAHLLGRPGSAVLADHGLRYLENRHRDARHGGYAWIVGRKGPVDPSKQGYGQAFVVLAAATATIAERPGAAELLEDALQVVDEHFWREEDGLCVEEFDEAWHGPGPYRGQNSNMHLVEALLTASEATGDSLHVRRAARIAERLIRDLTSANDWRLAEHYTTDWRIDPEYNRDDPEHLFRPYGSVVGHWFEWARLLLQVRAAAGSQEGGWMLDASRRLFERGVADGWAEEPPGILYTVDFEGTPLNQDRYWWPVAEAIGAAAYLFDATGEPEYERWYRRFWDYADRHVIDHELGSWNHVLDAENRPKDDPWSGKPDLYHALQACLLPLLPADEGIATSLAGNRLRLAPKRTP